MKIPFRFYIKYWMSNSIFGVIAIAMGSVFIAIYVVYPIVALIKTSSLETTVSPFPLYLFSFFGLLSIYQINLFRRILGKNRGEFEFECIRYSNDKLLFSLIKRNLGIIKLIRLWSDDKNEIGSSRGDILSELLSKEKADNDPDARYLIYLKLASYARKESDFSKAANYLKTVLAIHPNDLLANFNMAEVFERENSAENAISFYETATKSNRYNTPSICKFISQQIERVKTKGPKTKTPISGIKYNFE